MSCVELLSGWKLLSLPACKQKRPGSQTDCQRAHVIFKRVHGIANGLTVAAKTFSLGTTGRKE